MEHKTIKTNIAKALSKKEIKFMKPLEKQKNKEIIKINSKQRNKKILKEIRDKSRSVKNSKKPKKNQIANIKKILPKIKQQKRKKQYSSKQTVSNSQGKGSTPKILKSIDYKLKEQLKKSRPLKRNTEKPYIRSNFESPNSSKIIKQSEPKSRQVLRGLIKDKTVRNSLKQSRSYNTLEIIKSVEAYKPNVYIKEIKQEDPVLETKQSTSDKTIDLQCQQEIILSQKKIQEVSEQKDEKNKSLIRNALFFSNIIQNIFEQQTQINQRMRVILIDWIFRISFQLQLHRQTVYLALSFLDSFIKIKKIEKSKFQLVGLACLLIAYKQQESKKDNFVHTLVESSDNGYTREEILQMEETIIFKLQFKLNPTTYCFWVDYFTDRWDKFISKGKISKMSRVQQQIKCIQPSILFRDSSQTSYNLYRELILLVDTLIHVQKTLEYSQSKIVISALYILIRIEYQHRVVPETMRGLENRHLQMYNKFKKKPCPIFKDRYNVNQIFNEYLVDECEFDLSEIMVQIKYVVGFLDLKFVHDVPLALQQAADNVNYEEFLRFQIHSQYTRQYVLEKI